VLERLPAPLANLPAADAVTAFCTAIIDSTSDVACAYKLNLAFFEAMGPSGLHVFEAVVDAIGEERLIIADAKRGDIGNTARYYAAAYFEKLRCDAVTVSPYMGRDALEPFLSYPGRAAFSLVLTSNPGAADVQQLIVDGRPVYEHVAELVAAAGREGQGTAGFVVGGTWPKALASLRKAHPDVPFLVPGVGAQGGDPATIIEAAGAGPLVVNVSRAIIYASSGPDYARAAREAAESMRDALSAA
jgi:orotidine-5'-phosphate decarboxylase